METMLYMGLRAILRSSTGKRPHGNHAKKTNCYTIQRLARVEGAGAGTGAGRACGRGSFKRGSVRRSRTCARDD
eukprot:6176189-Pleurochrysis_carterae.AAC.8